uniref:ribose-phosphate diphosphokinase n=1 Tax=Ndongobacter massiliensis TaxID=1871025 RepID=UPI0009318C11|nr:ribose-phosphate pyrophosphokinase [Ndongobacter massiliensis]
MNTVGMKVFSGTSNRPLAEKICKHLGKPLGDLTVSHFADGEISVTINETVRGHDVFLIQPTSEPVNEHLMEALIIADALKRASVATINLVMPYYGYARQDRKTRGREPITAKLVADLITSAGVDRVVTLDLHAGQIQGYFDIPLDHFQAGRLLASYFQDKVGENPEDWIVVSPDLGGVTRARAFSHLLHLPIAIIEKVRPRPNESVVVDVIGKVKNKHCIIIDDIIDTAGTITNAADFLQEEGAREVYITASHAILSGSAVERIQNSCVKKCVVTDSIILPEEKRIDKIEVVSISHLMAEAISRISNNRSVSGLFV